MSRGINGEGELKHPVAPGFPLRPFKNAVAWIVMVAVWALLVPLYLVVLVFCRPIRFDH